MLDTIPYNFSLALAAKVAGVSPRTFRRLYLDTGLCKLAPDDLWHDGTGRGYIRIDRLQAALGRRLTLEECRAADAKLNARRKYQRTYRRRQKRNH